ncbi:MAG: hypothetical protein QOH42_938 [Blastocatellia bacterium]|nr:hypothetical protein [Blastocatellia bacterium]
MQFEPAVQSSAFRMRRVVVRSVPRAVATGSFTHYSVPMEVETRSLLGENDATALRLKFLFLLVSQGSRSGNPGRRP